MPATVIACPQSSETNAELGPVSFGQDYLARLRSGDDATLKHFNDHFRRLIRLKLWSQFSREQGEELANDVMAAVREKIMDGAPDVISRLPAYVFGICSTLANKQTQHPPAVAHNARRVTREQLRMFFLQRDAKPTGEGRA
jgi:hypothetical protein